MMMISIIIVSIFCTFGGYYVVEARVRINHVHVPSLAVTGDSAILRCVFDLGSENLYDLKWYRNRREFFRYVPETDPTLMVFPEDGIDVDISRSNETTVYLRNLSLQSAGNYTCEVSTGKPHFRLVYITKHMEVVESATTEEGWSCPEGGREFFLECQSNGELLNSISSRSFFFGVVVDAQCSAMPEQVYSDEEVVAEISSPEGEYPLSSKCPNENQVVAKFEFCLVDNLIRAVKLHCHSLKTQYQTEEYYDVSSANMNGYHQMVGCGEKGAIQGIQLVETESPPITKVNFNCVKLHI